MNDKTKCVIVETFGITALILILVFIFVGIAYYNNYSTGAPF